MSAAHAEGGSEIGRGRPSRQRFTDADEKRLKLLKARAAEANRRHRFRRGEAQRAARMSTLRKLLDVVLEMEPWNEERHVSGREAVWRDCWLRVPGLLKDSDPGNAPRVVQQRIFRMARQLNDPKAGHLWKSCPDVKERVENVLGKLATVTRFTRKRQGPAEHKNSTLATVETAHASPAQPATVQQHQQQGREKPEKPSLATVEAVHASPAQPATVQQHRQQGREKPERSALLQLAFHSYVAAAEDVSAVASTTTEAGDGGRGVSRAGMDAAAAAASTTTEAGDGGGGVSRAGMDAAAAAAASTTTEAGDGGAGVSRAGMGAESTQARDVGEEGEREHARALELQVTVAREREAAAIEREAAAIEREAAAKEREADIAKELERVQGIQRKQEAELMELRMIMQQRMPGGENGGGGGGYRGAGGEERAATPPVDGLVS